MSKKSKVSTNQANAVNSPKTLGYAFATNLGATVSLAAKAATLIPGFPENVAPEVKTEVIAGFTLRKAELVPVIEYHREAHDTWTPITGEVPKGVTPHEIGVAYAMAYSPTDFGKLKTETPNLHRIVKTIRDDVSKYNSNTWSRMVAMYKTSQDGSRERAANASWYDAMRKTLDGLATRAKNARTKGDTTAPDEAKIGKAIEAYLTAIK